jgi:hypothetical protein
VLPGSAPPAEEQLARKAPTDGVATAVRAALRRKLRRDKARLNARERGLWGNPPRGWLAH